MESFFGGPDRTQALEWSWDRNSQESKRALPDHVGSKDPVHRLTQSIGCERTRKTFGDLPGPLKLVGLDLAPASVRSRPGPADLCHIRFDGFDVDQVGFFVEVAGHLDGQALELPRSLGIIQGENRAGGIAEDERVATPGYGSCEGRGFLVSVAGLLLRLTSQSTGGVSVKG